MLMKTLILLKSKFEIACGFLCPIFSFCAPFFPPVIFAPTKKNCRPPLFQKPSPRTSSKQQTATGMFMFLLYSLSFIISVVRCENRDILIPGSRRGVECKKNHSILFPATESHRSEPTTALEGEVLLITGEV